MYRKFFVAAAGFVSAAVSRGLIAGTAGEWVSLALTALAAAGVYAVPNDPQP